MTVTIYHNPDSRNTLAMIRQSGQEPTVIEYLKTPPTRDTLKSRTAKMGITIRALLREKGTPYAELGLADPSLSDDAPLDAMMAHPMRPLEARPDRDAAPAMSAPICDIASETRAASSSIEEH
ncbi:ArsC/Spx/MgsR family protein [Bradyrhizobium sp.]|uniref:ArsC/Spx/MgsR family protein n=1 Tax=Bradyrhizobium sp. TaxID=376 RepID=UPI002639D7FD|nr:ArsC/Spx/MgsR family protein [Bradyrhizobium sp.]